MTKNRVVLLVLFLLAEAAFVFHFWNDDHAIKFLAMANAAGIVILGLYRLTRE